MEYLLILYNETGRGEKWGFQSYLYSERPEDKEIEFLKNKHSLYYYMVFEKRIGGYVLIACNS